MSVSPHKVLAVIPGQEIGQGFIFVRRQIDQIRQLGIAVEPFFLESRTHPIKLLRELRRFRRAIRLSGAQVVHAHYGTVTAFFCVLFSRKPIVITYRGSDLNPSSEYSWLRGLASRLLSQFAALGAKKIICVSDELRNRLWWRKNRAVVIPTGVDLTVFFPIERAQARKQLGWRETDNIVLFNHGFARAPNKRKDLVDEAVKILRSRLESVTLISMEGETPANQVPLYINASDVVVMTSDFEGSPNIVKEALACNVPVCSVSVGDVPQLIAGVSNCLLVDRQPAAIADGLFKLIQEPCRSNGRKSAENISASRNTELIAQVLRNSAGNAPAT